jgi:hypothetical protein
MRWVLKWSAIGVLAMVIAVVWDLCAPEKGKTTTA